MKIFRTDVGAAKLIDQYNSQHAAVTHLVENAAEATINAIYLGMSGTLGAHTTPVDQLFVVVSGRGWVQLGDNEPIAVRSGQAILWEAGEMHTSGTHHGMVAIVIEAPRLKLSERLQEWHYG